MFSILKFLSFFKKEILINKILNVYRNDIQIIFSQVIYDKTHDKLHLVV